MIEFDFEARSGGFRLAARGTIESGITGLFGPSGAGKTTLLHALAGLRRIDRGAILLDGRVLADAAAGVHLLPEERRVGVVFQDGRLFPHLGVAGNLRFGARAAAGVGAAPAFAEVVEALDLAPLLYRAVAGLSGGERQRVALGRALLAAPRLLLLDEPLASIDRARRGAILPYLRRLPARFGIPLLHVTHDLAEMLSLTERLILLERVSGDRVSGDRGEVRGAGSYRDLALRPEWLGPGSPLGRVNVLAGEVAAVEGTTCRVRIGGTELAAVGSGLEVGEAVTVTIGAEEIALAAGEIGATSIQNRLSARVLRRTDHEGATVVELHIAPTAAAGPAIALLVEVTTRAADQLALADGRPVTALLKASAVRLRGAT